jgi:rare lipoprotein A
MPDERRSFKARTCVAVACVTLASCAQVERRPSSEIALPEPQTDAVPTPPVAAPEARGASAETESAARLSQRGRISLYGGAFAGKRTASGEMFDPERLTMAHPTLPFGTRVRVTNLQNQRSVEVVVNDRGPFVPGRIADLSAAAARQIGMVVDGVVEALLEVLQRARMR